MRIKLSRRASTSFLLMLLSPSFVVSLFFLRFSCAFFFPSSSLLSLSLSFAFTLLLHLFFLVRNENLLARQLENEWEHCKQYVLQSLYNKSVCIPHFRIEFNREWKCLPPNTTAFKIECVISIVVKTISYITDIKCFHVFQLLFVSHIISTLLFSNPSGELVLLMLFHGTRGREEHELNMLQFEKHRENVGSTLLFTI